MKSVCGLWKAILIAGLIFTGQNSLHADDTDGGVVTFSRDIAPIFQENCQTCHRPGDIAPMSLLSYKEARPWAKSIKQAVSARTMPPWFADPAHGSFANDTSLTGEEIETITR